MGLQPTAIDLEPEQGEVHIRWSDGQTTRHSMSQLRRDCPCATCRAEREKMKKPGPVLRVIDGPVPAERQARVVEFTPVGRYAISFRWNDGHTTGIYSYEFLRQHALE